MHSCECKSNEFGWCPPLSAERFRDRWENGRETMLCKAYFLAGLIDFMFGARVDHCVLHSHCFPYPAGRGKAKKALSVKA